VGFYHYFGNFYKFSTTSKHGWLSIESSSTIRKVTKFFGQILGSLQMLKESLHIHFVLIVRGSKLLSLGRNHSFVFIRGSLSKPTLPLSSWHVFMLKTPLSNLQSHMGSHMFQMMVFLPTKCNVTFFNFYKLSGDFYMDFL